MEDDIHRKHHFLYYLFRKDDEENKLPEQTFRDLLQKILEAIKKPDGGQ